MVVIQMSKKVLIIIPAFNEEKNIGNVIQGIRNNFSEADILTINDGSIDKTSLIARAAGSLVLDHAFNLGYGSALQTGYKFAFKNGYEYVVQMDADGQHDSKSIKDLYEELIKKENDIIIGSRFLKNTYKPSFIRKIGMIFFAKIAELVTKQQFTDPTSGFIALNRRALMFYCQDVYPSDFPDVDVIIMSKKAGLSIKEIPVIMYPSETKKSMHSGLKPFYYIFKMCLSIIVTLLRQTNIEKENIWK